MKSFKINVKALLNKAGVSGRLLQKMANLIDGIFVGERSDVKLSSMSEKLKKKASANKK